MENWCTYNYATEGVDNMEENILIHWGILGQRKGKRRFQNYDGTLTEAGKLRYYKNYKPQDRQLLKNAAILRGDIRELQNNKDYFSRNEKDELLKNFDMNKRIDETYAAAYAKKGKNKLDEMVDKMDKLGKIANSVGNVANGVGKAYNLYKAVKGKQPVKLEEKKKDKD